MKNTSEMFSCFQLKIIQFIFPLKVWNNFNAAKHRMQDQKQPTKTSN